MKLAIDPYMFRHLSLTDMVRTVADIGYQYIELSPREDFIPFFLHPRADRARVTELKTALRETRVQLSSLLPLYRWSGPDEDERQAAVRYWKRAIEIAVELNCPVMNSEFNGRPERPAESEAQFWRSMEALLPIFEREGITLHLEAHPDDFIEQNVPAVNLVRGINSPWVRYLYCAPHTFHLGDDVPAMLRFAGPCSPMCTLRIASTTGRPLDSATSSIPQARRRASTSTWLLARATCPGTPFSAPCASLASTASPPPACSPGRSAHASRRSSCSSKSARDSRLNHRPPTAHSQPPVADNGAIHVTTIVERPAGDSGSRTTGKDPVRHFIGGSKACPRCAHDRQPAVGKRRPPPRPNLSTTRRRAK